MYGDPAYVLRDHLQRPFANPGTPLEKDHNISMSKVTIAVECFFADISNWWALDFKTKIET